MKRRFLCLLLTLFLLIAALPLPLAHAARTQVTLSDLREKFPSGKYWNHHSGSNNPNGYSDAPCGHTHGNCDYYGSCGCNSFDNAIQCLGFTYKLGYDYYGTSVKTWPKTDTLDGVKPGDIIRYRDDSHSVFVTAVTDTTITYADCNMDRHCRIRWDVTVSRELLERLLTNVCVAPYAAVEGLPPEGTEFLNTQSSFLQYDTVNFRWNESEEADTYRLTVLRDGETLFSRSLGCSLAFALRLDNAGDYTAHLTGTNQYGDSEEAAYEFTVLPRARSTMPLLSSFPDWTQKGMRFLTANLPAGSADIDPSLSVSHAMLATLLWRAAGRPSVTTEGVAQDKWYSNAAMWAKGSNLLYPAHFDPDAVVTREQLAVILFRFAGRYGSVSSLRADLSTYPDHTAVSEDAAEAMRWAVATGLLAGSGSGSVVYLAPKDAVTGEEALHALAACLPDAVQTSNAGSLYVTDQ